MQIAQAQSKQAGIKAQSWRVIFPLLEAECV